MKRKYMAMAAMMLVMLLNQGCKENAEAKKFLAEFHKVNGSEKSELIAPWFPPGDIPDDADQRYVDRWGWQLFIYANWPAEPGRRGVPVKGGIIGRGDKTVVWETWKAPEEVFWADGKKHGNWETYSLPGLPNQCPKPNKGELLIDRTNQAVGGSVMAQNNTMLHYFISFDKTIFDYIMKGYGQIDEDKGYYNVRNQGKSTVMNFSPGAMEMKASWKIITPGDDKERYILRKSIVFTPAQKNFDERGNRLPDTPATCSSQEVALVGLHFIRKVKVKGSPQWVMATFEQVDNVPPFGTYRTPGKEPGRTLPYSLFNMNCYSGGCIYNQSIEDRRPWYKPTEVIRVVDIGPEAKKLNQDFRRLFESINSKWQYYEMIDTQWTYDPTQPPLGQPTPMAVSNTTMETYLKVGDSSCLGCHHTAKTKDTKVFGDYSFMFAQACPDNRDFPWSWPANNVPRVIPDVCK